MSGARLDWRTLLVPGIPCVLFALQLARFTLTPASSMMLSTDGDIALHLLHGQQMWQQGSWLATEPTCFMAADTPYIAHEWGAQLLFAASYALLGLAGPVLLASLAVSGLYWALYRRCEAWGARTWPTLLLVLAAVPMVNMHVHPRPHVATWVACFVSMGLLERLETGRMRFGPWLAAACALQLVWSNLHGGFLASGVILGLYGLGALARGAWGHLGRLVGAGLLLLAVSALNPWGLHTHTHFLAWLADPFLMSMTTEFQSPNFRDAAGLIHLVWLGIAIVLLVAPRERPAPRHLALFLGFAALSLQSGRHAPLLALLCTPIFALQAQRWIEQSASALAKGLDASSKRLDESEGRHGGLVTGGLIAVAITGVLGAGVVKPDWDPDILPVGAADWIEAHPEQLQGRMFNHFNWGGYLAWRLYPGRQVYVNSWHDHLGADLMRRYHNIADAGPQWRELVDADEVQWVVHDPNSAIAYALDHDDGWERVYGDETAAIWSRR